MYYKMYNIIKCSVKYEILHYFTNRSLENPIALKIIEAYKCVSLKIILRE